VHLVWIGAVMLAGLGVAAEGTGAVARLTAADWAAMAYLAMLVTAVAFLLWCSAVVSLGAGRVGLLTGIAPVSAALSGIVTGSHAPSPLVWSGILVVISGLAGGLRAGPTPCRSRAGAATLPDGGLTPPTPSARLSSPAGELDRRDLQALGDLYRIFALTRHCRGDPWSAPVRASSCHARSGTSGGQRAARQSIPRACLSSPKLREREASHLPAEQARC
jgi:hypothetical protein